MAIDAPVHTNEANLSRVLSAGLPVVLVFWKRECSPCDKLAPALDEVAKRYAGEVLIVKVNAADEPGLARRYSVAQLPTLLFIKGNDEVARGTGAVAASEVSAWVEYLVTGGARPPLIAGPTVPLSGGAPPHPPPGPGRATGTSQQAGARHGAGTGQAAHPVVVTDNDFAQIIGESTVPVLVDLWAEWCGPCKMIAPHVAALAQEFAGRALVAKMNVDENPRTAGQFGIMSIPTLLIFSGGRVVDQIVGAQPAQVLRQRLSRHVR